MRWWQSSKAQICCKRCMKTRVVGNQAEKHISHLLIGPWLLILFSWIKHLLAMLGWKWSYISCWYSGINAAAINLNAMPPSFARCVLCRAKILRLKQHHKGQRHPREKASSQEATSSSALSESETQGGVPQSVSNYSITRLSSSSSNHSFASGNITTSRILSL